MIQIDGKPYITLKEWGDRHGVDPVLIRQRAQRGTAPDGMVKVGKTWLVPEDMEMDDFRRKRG